MPSDLSGRIQSQSGRQALSLLVGAVRMRLLKVAERRRDWPRLFPPSQRGAVSHRDGAGAAAAATPFSVRLTTGEARSAAPWGDDGSRGDEAAPW